MSEPVNDALRAHVTRVGFDLSLGKTHIAMLVWIDQHLKANKASDPRFYSRGLPRVFAHSAVGTHGLIDRGLVEHILERRRRPGERAHEMTPRRIWRITPAGRLVIGLLKEAGIYQEYAALIPAAPAEAAS